MRLIRLCLTAYLAPCLLSAVITVALAGAAAPPPPPAAAASPADDGFVPLFDGKSLEGWVVTDCKAAVEDGKLVILEGNGFVRTEKRYGDFVLELEWKNRKPEKFDSGVFFRANLPAAGKPWPTNYQINLLDGQEGTLVYHKLGKAAGLAKAGEWNRMRLSATGATAVLEVNGKPAWKVEDLKNLDGHIGIQVEVPGGGQFEFRNIRVKALTLPTTAPATQPAAAPAPAK